MDFVILTDLSYGLILFQTSYVIILGCSMFKPFQRRNQAIRYLCFAYLLIIGLLALNLLHY